MGRAEWLWEATQELPLEGMAGWLSSALSIGLPGYLRLALLMLTLQGWVGE